MKEFITEKISDFIRNTKYGIENIINWFPIIWKDRQWDHYFFNIILQHKLKLMSKHLKEYGCHVNAKNDAKKIDLCVNLLDRIIKDEYHENVFYNHDKKWGKVKLSFKDTDDPELSEVCITRKNVNDETKKQERKEYMRLSEQTEYLMIQDINLLYKTISKNIRSWWD